MRGKWLRYENTDFIFYDLHEKCTCDFNLNLSIKSHLLPEDPKVAGLVWWLTCWTCESMVPGSSLLGIWVYVQRGASSISLIFLCCQPGSIWLIMLKGPLNLNHPSSQPASSNFIIWEADISLYRLLLHTTNIIRPWPI